MDYLNVLIPMLRAPPFLGTSCHEKGVWLSVMSYCCQQENGGRIDGAGAWTSDMMMFSIGVSLADIKKCTRVVKIDGNDIVATGYPDRSQKALNAKRKAAEDTNRKRWGGHGASESHSDNATDSPSESGIERERERERETPKPPEGDLSAGEVPFVPLAQILKQSGKFSDGTTPMTLAVIWRNLCIAGRPDDPAVLEHLTAAVGMMPGKISAPGSWLQARVAELATRAQNEGQKFRGAADPGPCGSAM